MFLLGVVGLVALWENVVIYLLMSERLKKRPRRLVRTSHSQFVQPKFKSRSQTGFNSRSNSQSRRWKKKQNLLWTKTNTKPKRGKGKCMCIPSIARHVSLRSHHTVRNVAAWRNSCSFLLLLFLQSSLWFF